MECSHRGERLPLSPDHADGNIHGSRVDTDRGNDILGPDGHRRHGRFAGRDGSDPDLSAGIVCRLVPYQGARSNGEDCHAQPHCYGRSMNLAPSRPAVVRAVGFFVLWIMLTGGNPADLGAGAVAALAATWASVRLLPPGTNRVRPVALTGLTLRFLRQSVVAGVDVARRALDPRLPLHLGFVVYPTGLPRGPGRNMFTAVMSLLPGTVPT